MGDQDLAPCLVDVGSKLTPTSLPFPVSTSPHPPLSTIRLVDHLSTAKSLRFLSLAKCQIGTREVEALVTGLERNRSIVNLDLSNNLINGRGADAIGRLLESPVIIRKLNLAWNSIGKFGGSSGAERICAAISVTNSWVLR